MAKPNRLLVALCSITVAGMAVTGCGAKTEPTPSGLNTTAVKGNGTFTPTAKNIRVYRTTPVVSDNQKALMVYGVIFDPFKGDAEFYNSGSSTVSATLHADVSSGVAETSDITNEGFVAKVTLDGTWAWVKGLPFSVNSTPTFTQSGLTYFTNYYTSTPNNMDFVDKGRADQISQLDTNGNVVWAKSVAGATNFTGANITVDNDNSPAIVSASESGVSATGFGDSASVTKLSTNGDVVWNHQIKQNKLISENAMVAPMTTNAFDDAGKFRVVVYSPDSKNYKLVTLSASTGAEDGPPTTLGAASDTAISSYSFTANGKGLFAVTQVSDPTGKGSITSLETFTTISGKKASSQLQPEEYEYSYVACNNVFPSSTFAYLLPIAVNGINKVDKINADNITTTVFPTSDVKGYDPVLSVDASGTTFTSYADKPYAEPAPLEIGASQTPSVDTSPKSIVKFTN